MDVLEYMFVMFVCVCSVCMCAVVCILFSGNKSICVII